MKGAWIDRKTLISRAKSFVRSHGYFIRKNGHRLSSLVEIAVYNSVVKYYESEGFTVEGRNLGPKQSFKYKLTASGLADNYSFFVARRDSFELYLLHNIRIQSAHHDHLYFTADVVVAEGQGATTVKLKSGKRHSYVANPDLVTFVEVKHLNPFPEVLFNFMGLVLEFMPSLVEKSCMLTDEGVRFCPTITFTGPGSKHADLIQEVLSKRYGVNIVFGTSSTFGALSGFDEMNRYERLRGGTPERTTARATVR